MGKFLCEFGYARLKHRSTFHKQHCQGVIFVVLKGYLFKTRDGHVEEQAVIYSAV